MDENVISENEHVVPRRAVLKHGAAVAAGSAVGLFGNQPTYSQQQEVASIVTGTQAGRRFRAWVQDGHISSGSIEELTLLGLQSRQVLVRPEASAPCYTLVQGGYGGTPMVDTPDNVDGNSLPEISNHTAVGNSRSCRTRCTPGTSGRPRGYWSGGAMWAMLYVPTRTSRPLPVFYGGSRRISSYCYA